MPDVQTDQKIKKAVVILSETGEENGDCLTDTFPSRSIELPARLKNMYSIYVYQPDLIGY